jgi:peptide/nickel transport system substrate-binding protein
MGLRRAVRRGETRPGVLARFRGAVLAMALAAGAAAGCGDGEGDAGAVGDTGLEAGTGGALVYALAGPAQELDPLLARTRSEQVVTRQVHEPLVETLTGPFGVRGRRGLARSARPSSDRELWRFELRRGVTFQDGTPFDASAVVVNAERWRTLAPGRALLPELVAADAPRPDLVRFVLSRPVGDLPRRLASPRLGIVSPAALRPQGGRAAELVRADRSGTGPFELRERERERIVIARNVGWWGTRLDLGPALDQVEFRVVPADRERLALLRGGTAQVADSLPRSIVGEIRREPLLTFSTGRGSEVLGLERSVRGIDSASAIEPLSEVWLTTIGAE